MKPIIKYIIVLFTIVSFGQDINFTTQNLSINKHIDGTLLMPNKLNATTLAILIADSGPTDRDGNQNFQKNNVLKKLAEGLSNQNIATFRYDKRIVKQIRKGNVDPNISFVDFVNDAIAVIDYFKSQNSYSKIIIIGHGQGSLVGLVASKVNVDQFISLAGSGKSIDNVIIDQIAQMDPALIKDTKLAFESLKKGQLTKDYPQALSGIFSSDVQPFIMSWMQYNPQELIKNLEIPTLIINGTKDLQVPVSEAELLKNASPDATFKLISNMNHVLFIIDGKELENSKSYNESFRTISSELITELITFIRN
ncbi:alpha/beta hydrolase [Psychroserpens ponticola]|uniref:Alpha/beta hydrolase n=1 Tax=Psychroserpens ponticola TaxID=2932268 RepID=A0ABY7RUG9_9FLAO|nr:alpha/beta hydrolase [Psychroserpens ponticola]WCO00772.1 alpha/beta hydrolase [Psychroserpens ponticola]